MAAASTPFWSRVEDTRALRHEFWRKFARVAARIPFAEDLLAAYFCAFDRNTPLYVKSTLIGALAYFVLPTDTIPDFLPALGFTDDAAVLVGALKMVSNHVTPLHRQTAREWLNKLVTTD